MLATFDVDAVETGAARDTEARAYHCLLDQGLLLVFFFEWVEADGGEHWVVCWCGAFRCTTRRARVLAKKVYAESTESSAALSLGAV